MTTVIETPTPTPTPATITSTLSKDYAWVVSHLLALALVGALVLGAVYLIESTVAKHDAARATESAQTLAVVAGEAKDLKAQLATDEDHWAQIEAQLLSTNSTLAKNITTRNQDSTKQTTVDASLSSIDAASHLTASLTAAPNEIAASGNTVVVDLPMSRKIASDLDLLPVVQSNLSDTQSQLTNETQVATAAQNDVAEQKKLVSAQQTQITDASKACDAQVAAVKSAAKAGKVKAFFIGVGTVVIAIIGNKL